MEQRINYKGLTRLPSDISSFDGEMEEVINLVATNGELRPYIPPVEMGAITGRLMFVHKNQGWEHFIALDGVVIKAYNYNGSTLSLIGSIVNIYGETLRQVTAVGNILIILTDHEVKYAIWENSAYKYIGAQLPFPRISFTLSQITPNLKTLSLDGFESDITNLWNTDGYHNRGPRSSATTRVSTRPTEEGTETKNVVSTGFEDKVRGAINKQLELYRTQGKYIFPFFIRYALRLYDGTLTRHSPPILMTPTRFYPFTVGLIAGSGGSRPTEDKVHLSFNPAQLKYSYEPITSATSFKDIVASVDIFMSEPIYTYEQDGLINGVLDKPSELSSAPVDKILGGIYYDRETTLKKIAEVGQFYKILSIPFERFSSASEVTEYKPDSTEYLAQNELMSDEYQSHHTIAASNAFVYNHKIHLSGVKQWLFAGFSYAGSAGFLSYHVGNLKPSGLYASIQNNPLIYYPDARGTSFVATYTQGGSTKNKEYPLSSHSALNGSFYLNPTLEAFNPANDNKDNVSYQGTAGRANYEELRSTLFVSTIQNPFVFPASGRVTLPVGEIIAVTSNTEAISQGQFGQFPLYVFTDDGIWAMEVSSDGRYMTRQPISREVCTNPNIMQLDKYIAFISKRGLNILHGSSTECITEIIREQAVRTTKLGLTHLLTTIERGDLLAIYNTVTIEEYMQNCQIAYEYLRGNGAIYLINSNYNYSYMFDIESKSWSKVLGRYRNSVTNYPDCYIQKSDGALFNLSENRATDEEIDTMYVTRALKADEALIQIKRIRQSGIWGKDKLVTAIYGSRDGVNYSLITATRNTLVRQIGSPFKFFKIVAIADMKMTDVLSSITIDVEQRYSNRLR